jgi:hypothetical protein
MELGHHWVAYCVDERRAVPVHIQVRLLLIIATLSSMHPSAYNQSETAWGMWKARQLMEEQMQKT